MGGHMVAERGRTCMCIMAAALVFLTPIAAQGLVLQTDREQYESGQAIKISGNVEGVPTGDAVTIRTIDPYGSIQGIQQVNVSKAGTFESVVDKRLAGGMYAIQATYDGVNALVSVQVNQPAAEPEVGPAGPEDAEQAELAVDERPEQGIAAPAESSESGTDRRDLPAIFYELGTCLIDTSCGFWYLALVVIFVTLGLGTHRISRRGGHDDDDQETGPEGNIGGLSTVMPPPDMQYDAGPEDGGKPVNAIPSPDMQDAKPEIEEEQEPEQ